MGECIRCELDTDEVVRWRGCVVVEDGVRCERWYLWDLRNGNVYLRVPCSIYLFPDVVSADSYAPVGVDLGFATL